LIQQYKQATPVQAKAKRALASNQINPYFSLFSTNHNLQP